MSHSRGSLVGEGCHIQNHSATPDRDHSLPDKKTPIVSISERNLTRDIQISHDRCKEGTEVKERKMSDGKGVRRWSKAQHKD